MAKKKRNYSTTPKSITVNLNKVHIGGPYADMLRAKNQDKSNTVLVTKPNLEVV